MEEYQILSTIKIIIWILTITLVSVKLTPSQDLLTWVVLMLIGGFLVIWWISYRVLYFAYLNFSHKKLIIISWQCYKISFFVAIYGLINLMLIVREIRNIYIWLAITWFFVSIWILLYRKLNYIFDNFWQASTISSQDIK